MHPIAMGKKPGNFVTLNTCEMTNSRYIKKKTTPAKIKGVAFEMNNIFAIQAASTEKVKS